MFQKVFSWIQARERHLSALAMIAGFVFDTLFFDRIDVWETHAVFAGYALLCGAAILLLHWIEERRSRGIVPPRLRAILPLVVQFTLGGFWSGFVIFYGRSAVLGASWPFLLFLVLVFIGNEYFSKYHDRLVFTTLLYFFALYSYAIFAVPIYTHTLGMTTFLVSGVVAITVFALFIFFVRLVGRERFRSYVWPIRLGALVVVILMNVSYFTNILPPLPLSAEAAGVYHTVWRVPGAYMAEREEQSWYVRYGGGKPTLHVAPGEFLYAYSSVFAPTALSTKVVHLWQWYDPTQKRWVQKARVPYNIVGGRDGGYRGYSLSAIHQAGVWRVSIETSDGRLIARLPFMVEFVENPPRKESITLD